MKKKSKWMAIPELTTYLLALSGRKSQDTVMWRAPMYSSLLGMLIKKEQKSKYFFTFTFTYTQIN